jgi:phosphoribosylaminoimidazole-succinocarboxamide synthase
MVHSNRLSAFDRHITDIPNKGLILTKISANWFKQLHEIGIKTHYLNHYNNVMFVKKCEMIPIEMVIRGYITGNTRTALWTHYNNGERLYCGIKLPDGLKKNQKLESNIITPTTKGEKDELISVDNIVKRGLMTQNQYNICSDITHKVFSYGQNMANKNNLLLVDTKYEFGIDYNGEILLCDELHTFDSSRYWLKKTYKDNFLLEKEPNKFDKDIIRDYIYNKCDPYNDIIPNIPEDLILKMENLYLNFYKMLFGKSLKITINKSMEYIIQNYINYT